VNESEEHERTILAWRSALWAAALNVLGTPIEPIVGRRVANRPNWPVFACLAVGLCVIVWLLLRRNRVTRLGAGVAFLVNTAAIVVMLWLENRAWAELGERWAPFEANKLGAFIVGLLAPELWVGVLSIAGYGLSATLQWFTLPPALRDQLAFGEPVITLIFALFGVALLLQSTQRYALQRRLVARGHQAESLERLARALLAVRDLTNTPVQTIELTIAALAVQHPEAAGSFERVGRALIRLRRLNQVLSEYESDVNWAGGGESFDPLEVLRRDSA
jgi:hypothetical protein